MKELIFTVHGVKTAKPVKIPESKLREIVTTRLESNPYWRFSKALTREEVEAYLKGTRYPELLKKVAQYILFYAENIVFSSYLIIKAFEGDERAEEYLESMKPLLNDLREHCRNLPEEPEILRKAVEHMVFECVDCGIDPF